MVVSGGFHLNSKGIELALKVSVVIIDVLLDGIEWMNHEYHLFLGLL